jgi:hypothetical protein
MYSGSNDEKLLELENSEIELYDLVDLLPEPEHLNEIALTCGADIFLEVLMGNIRNALISFQAWIQKYKQAKAAATAAQINALKTNYYNNVEEIFRLESDLKRIREAELAIKVKELKIFENLHNEKPSPLFLTLTRSKTNDDLHCIRDKDGNLFSENAEREKFIVDF